MTTDEAKDKLDFTVGDNAAGALLGFVQRVERLDEEMDGLKADRKEVMEEAASAGFDTKTLRKVIRLRAMDPKDREAQQALIDTYMAALEGK